MKRIQLFSQIGAVAVWDLSFVTAELIIHMGTGHAGLIEQNTVLSG